MTDPVHPGVIWRELIENAGVTQAWVARQIGKTNKHVNHIVNRRTLPAVDVVLAFANLLDVDPVRLWCDQAEYVIVKAIRDAESKKGQVTRDDKVKPKPPPARWAARP